MIAVHRFGNLGDALGQYCFGRLLARNFNYALRAIPLPGFPETFLDIDGEEILAPDLHIEGQWPRDAYSGRNLERGELTCAPRSKLTVRGGFQRVEFYRELENEIREKWLKLSTPPSPRGVGDFAICLRSTMNGKPQVAESEKHAKRFETASLLNEQEVRRLAATVSYSRLYLVTNLPEHPLVRALRDLGGEVVVEGEMKEFLFLRSFQKVAISQDSLSWWASFLGHAREIYFPKCDRGIWSHPEPSHLSYQPWWHGIDLRGKNDPRYVYDW